MIKFRLYLNKDAEAEWLNQMAAEGWAMKRFFAGFFAFERCEKGEYVYQVDFGDRLFSVSSDYRELLQDTGIEIVQTWGYWVILRKKASEGKFELYTDVASSIGHYKKIRRMFKVVTIMEMLIMFFELYMGVAFEAVLGYAAALLLAVILVGLVNVLVRVNDIIADLEEKMTGIAKKYRGRNISAFLAVGLLLNSCSLMLMDVLPHPAKYTIQILAIVLMLVGIVRTGLGKCRTRL
ncbi:MAG: DUF2812 domain-containing protein [Lachnospiraceae bacterium]